MNLSVISALASFSFTIVWPIELVSSATEIIRTPQDENLVKFDSVHDETQENEGISLVIAHDNRRFEDSHPESLVL